MPKTPPNAPWLQTADAYMGVTEIGGAASNPLIDQMFESAKWDTKGVGDETPWCGAFVDHCLRKNKILPPALSVRATSWSKWGRACAPQRGAVAVVKRTGGHHVAFIARVSPTHVYLLGGNQSNSVNITAWPRSSIVATRWPDHTAGWTGPVTDREIRNSVKHEVAHTSSKHKSLVNTERVTAGLAGFAGTVAVVKETVSEARTSIDVLLGFVSEFGAPLFAAGVVAIFGITHFLKSRQIDDAVQGKYVADAPPDVVAEALLDVSEPNGDA